MYFYILLSQITIMYTFAGQYNLEILLEQAKHRFPIIYENFEFIRKSLHSLQIIKYFFSIYF